MHGERVDGLNSYHAPASYSPEAAAVVRDEMLESLRVKWDMRWYFLANHESHELVPTDPPGLFLGLTSLNYMEMVRNFTWKLL
jgi:hypothetical protein